MPLEENKELVRRSLDEVLNGQNTEAIPKFMVSGQCSLAHSSGSSRTTLK